METNFTPLESIRLESIRIATPCHADWNKMKGDDRVRFCSSCAKNVYNFSTMTRAEAERLMLEKEGNLCIQLHRRADGTVITSDCSIGVSSTKRSRRPFFALMTTIVAAVLGAFGVRAANAKDKVFITGGLPVLEPTPTPKPVPIRIIRGSGPDSEFPTKPRPLSAPVMPRGPRVIVMDDAHKPIVKPVKIPTKAHGNRPTGKPAKSDLHQH